MNLQDAEAALQRVLDPMPFDSFLDETLGRKFIKLDGRPHAFRNNLLGADPAVTLLSHYEDYAPRLGCHAADAKTPPPTARRVSGPQEFRALVDEYHQIGYTVRAPDVRNATPQLAEFIRALEFIFSCPVMVESFWSRGDAKAPTHHDDYDIIAIQLMGKKRWYISTDRSPLPNVWRTIPDKPPALERYETVIVEPGDLLYLPRGTEHCVDAIADSIHLSIGFLPVTLREAMIAMIDHLSDQDRSLREGVDSRITRSLQNNDFGNLPAKIRDGMHQLAAACVSDQFVADAMQRRAARVIGGFPKLPKSSHAQPATLSSRLRHATGAIAHLSCNELKIDFTQPGDHIYVARAVEESLRFIADTPEFTVADIPGQVADDIRVALAQRFVASGFLETVEV